MSKSENKEQAGDQLTQATQARVLRHYKFKQHAGVANGTEEILEVRRFVTPPATVRMDLGLTLNMENFEFARIDVGITVPCYQEEVGDAYEWAKLWVVERLMKEKDAVRGKSDETII